MDASGDDRVLLARVATGEARAFEAFVRRWESPLYRFLVRLTGSASLAEDARQLTLVRVYTRSGSFRGGSVRAWLFRIAYTVGLNARRDEARRTVPRLDPRTGVVDAAPPPPEAAERAEDRRRVRDALERMDESDRLLLWLRVAEGLSFDEVGDVLDAPPTTLRYRFTRALARMRRELGKKRGCGAEC